MSNDTKPQIDTHTPGPWAVEYRRLMTITGKVHRVIAPGRFPSAFVPAWDEPSGDEVDGAGEAEANARLIAAAPDLLAVCKMIVDAVESGDEMAVVDAAHAAIAKAEGR